MAGYGTPYSIGEAESVAKDQLDQIPDVYHRELFAWLCAEVRGLQRFRDLRLRHNDEMERRTSERAQLHMALQRYGHHAESCNVQC